jgi:hypothetical protein
MPLPIGHSAIGFATHSLISNDKASFNKWHMAIFIIILSNLPDMDVLFGLILQNNGSAFHRGPTHSILFALIMGYIASKSSKIWSLYIFPIQSTFCRKCILPLPIYENQTFNGRLLQGETQHNDLMSFCSITR